MLRQLVEQMGIGVDRARFGRLWCLFLVDEHAIESVKFLGLTIKSSREDYYQRYFL